MNLNCFYEIENRTYLPYRNINELQETIISSFNLTPKQNLRYYLLQDGSYKGKLKNKTFLIKENSSLFAFNTATYFDFTTVKGKLYELENKPFCGLKNGLCMNCNLQV